MTAALRVLIVEDSPTDATLIAAALQLGGREVHHERVDDASAMRCALAAGNLDVITCDWAMPGFSAMEALAILKESGLDLPFIIVAGAVGEDLAVEAMRAGAHDYVLKDRLARLAAAVDREIRTAQVRASTRKAHSALSASEARYREIVENLTQGVWVIDRENRTTFVNARMAEMLGSTAAEVIGRSPAEFLDDEGRAILADHVARHRKGQSQQTEVCLLRGDGSTLDALVESTPVLCPSGEHDGAFAIVMDVTARKNAEESLRLSEARFKCLWDSGIILITISDMNGRIVDLNDGFVRTLGYSRDELLGGTLRWHDITPAEWRHADETALGQLAATGVATAWEKELIAKDGRRVPVLAGAALLDKSEGIAIAIDLTERKLVDMALYERTRIAALTATVAVALTNGDTLDVMLQHCAEAVVQHLGAAFARIWTLDANARTLELQASAGMYTHRDGAHARIPVGKLKIGTIAHSREAYLTNDVLQDPEITDPEWARREKMVAFAGYPLVVGGVLAGVIAMFAREAMSKAALEGLRVVADAIALGIQRKRAEASKDLLEGQLRQAQKLEAIGSLAGGVAHDFNNILSVIISYSEFLAAELEPGHPFQAAVEEINTAGLRGAALTRQLLAFSRGQVLQPRVLNLNDVVRNVRGLLRRLVTEDIDLVANVDRRVSNVHADPGQIEQILMNLVVNARDAMPGGGTLTIETANTDLDAGFTAEHAGTNSGPHVMLSVKDTGIGMDAAIQARIFEPFFTTKEKGKGTGLGLSTVFGIVKQSGASIYVDSEPNVGTTFRLYFPTVDASLAPAATSSNMPVLRGSETILLCEDDERVRVLVRTILNKNGYCVLAAQNAGEALMMCEQHDGTIHLLLTDVVMPLVSGRQLAQRLQPIRPDMKVLYMSGYTDDAIVRHGVLREGLAFLHKPITPEALSMKVREVLNSA